MASTGLPQRAQSCLFPGKRMMVFPGLPATQTVETPSFPELPRMVSDLLASICRREPIASRIGSKMFARGTPGRDS